jgi:biotin carboxylase
MSTLPPDLPATRILRPGVGDTAREVLTAVAGMPRPDLVIAMSEYDLLSAARVRAELAVPGDREANVLLVRDKVLMKAAVARAGLRVPRFLPLPSALAGESAGWAGPTVVKPLDGASSQDVTRFDTLADALDAVRRGGLPTGADPAGFEIEEFVTGSIIHVDGMMVDGRPVAIQASRYVGTCLGYAQGRPLGSVQIPTTTAVTDWALECLRAVGIRTNLFHLEGIETPDGVVFLEVGARFGGADVVDTFALATGLHLPSSLLQVWTGGAARFDVRTPGPAERYGWFVWPGHQLKSDHCRIRDAEPFRDSPLAWRWVQRRDDEVVKQALSYSDTDVPLAGIVGPAPAPVLRRFLEKLFDQVQIEAAALVGVK